MIMIVIISTYMCTWYLFMLYYILQTAFHRPQISYISMWLTIIHHMDRLNILYDVSCYPLKIIDANIRIYSYESVDGQSMDPWWNLLRVKRVFAPIPKHKETQSTKKPFGWDGVYVDIGYSVCAVYLNVYMSIATRSTSCFTILELDNFENQWQSNVHALVT